MLAFTFEIENQESKALFNGYRVKMFTKYTLNEVFLESIRRTQLCQAIRYRGWWFSHPEDRDWQ